MPNPTKPTTQPTQPLQSKADIMYAFSTGRTRLISKTPFFGYLAMQMTPRLAQDGDNVPTAGIAPDGTVILNQEFCSKLTSQQMAGLVAHEVMHPALHFWGRKKNRNHRLFNIAHDLSFNGIIMEMAKGEIELPPGGLHDKKFDGMAAEEIYDYLQKGDQGTPGITKCGLVGGGHTFINANDDSSGSEFEDCRGDLSSTEKGQRANRGDTSAQKQMESEWKINLAAAAQEHEKTNQGTLPANLKRYLDEILHPKLSWEEILERWVGENGQRDDYGFSRPNRRSEAVATILPSFCTGGKADVCLLIDTSGSIPEDRLKRVLGETQGVCDAIGVEVRAMVVDATLHDDLTIEDARKLGAALKGGGGSDFCPAFEKLHEDGFEGAVIAFTDGMITVPDFMPPSLKGVLWITDKRERPPTEQWGDHLQVGTGLKDDNGDDDKDDDY